MTTQQQAPAQGARRDAYSVLIEPGLTSKSETTRLLAQHCYDAARAHTLIHTHIRFLGKLRDHAHDDEMMLEGWRSQLVLSLAPLVALLFPLHGAGAIVVGWLAGTLATLFLVVTIGSRVRNLFSLRDVAADVLRDEHAVGDLPLMADLHLHIDLLHSPKCYFCHTRARVGSFASSLLLAVAARDQRSVRINPSNRVHLSCLVKALRDLHEQTEKEAESDLREMGTLLKDHVTADVRLGAIDLDRRATNGAETKMDTDTDTAAREEGIA